MIGNPQRCGGEGLALFSNHRSSIKNHKSTMPASLDDLVLYCDKRTRRAAFKDAPGAFNGLQVANSGRVTKIGAAVDAGVAPFQKAVAAAVDFLIVHHGMYWDMPRPLTGGVYARVATLVHGNCALSSNHQIGRAYV